MILHRFCSEQEFRKYMNGETLVNDKDHGRYRGYDVSTAVGFCFFSEQPGKAVRRLSGIVDLDVCLTVKVKHTKVKSCHGRYTDWRGDDPVGAVMIQEFCATTYNNKDFKFIKADRSFAGTRPNGRDIFALSAVDILEELKKRQKFLTARH